MPTPYAPGAGSDEPGRVPEEGIRELEQDPGAVAAVGLGARGAAMTEVDERLDALLDDRVSRAAGDPGDERDAAGVMFDGRVETDLDSGAVSLELLRRYVRSLTCSGGRIKLRRHRTARCARVCVKWRQLRVDTLARQP